MEQARNARYDLMHDYCELKNIKTLCVGHHADDQLETFLFRLAKGSGLDGLTGMREWTDFKTLKLYRPLLQLTHSELIHYCNNNGLKYFDDPLNEDNKYARPRLRQALRKEGLDTKRFIKTLDRLARGRDALDEMAETIFELLYMKRDNINTLDYQSLKKYPLDIQIRVLQKAISYVGYSNGYYPPKLERIEEIIATLCPNKSATLYGCLISLSKDGYTLEIKHA
jgi:tRNA(Ile)-lysidine synthase